MRWAGAGLLVVLVLAGALALDLSSRGLAWRFAWSVTGEEEPVAQMRGVLQWLGGFTRARPDTQPAVPIDHTNVNPYGINTFLEQEPDPAKVEAQVRMIADAGFAWMRQQFVWEDIEIEGPGIHTDSRNDMDGDGVIDTISSWLKYDRMVDLADAYGLQIIGRLDNPPDWSRADETVGDFGPPDDLQHFVDFAVAVAARYEGRVRHFQVWNEPNLGFEWGNRPVDPYRYTEMLCRTYDALKAVDPEIVVITGALAPTIELNGFNLQDFVYLQQMYNAGASGCFDVLSIQAYGLNSGPTDRRMDPNRVNIARSVYIRDIMVANGDADKPIWISEAAWNSVPTEAEYPGEISLRTAYGQVTQQQAADYITRYYERVNEEWPWIGVVNYWFFTRRDDSESDQAFYYFRMVEPYYDDGRTERPFPPLPVYTAMRAHIATYAPVLYTGVHQADDAWAATTDGEGVSAGGAQFGRAVRLDEGESLTVTVHGTDALVRWRPEGETEWRTQRLALSRTAGMHQVTLSAGDGSLLGEGPLLVDSILVVDRTVASALGLIVIAVTAALMLVIALGEAVWRRRQA